LCNTLESAIQSWTKVGGGWSAMVLKEFTSDYWSQPMPFQDVQPGEGAGAACGLLVQWLLLLPEHESWGCVLTWHGQKGLWALLSRRYQVGVHGDVPLPRVDVRRPWRSGPVVVAGGSSGGRGGVARVTTTATTAVVVFAAVATSAVIVVCVPVVVAVGRSRRCERLRLRSRRHSAGVECRRSNRWPNSV
jgi:hypothetical protein